MVSTFNNKFRGSKKWGLDTLTNILTVKCATEASQTRVVRASSTNISSALSNTHYADASASIFGTSVPSGNWEYVVLS